MTSKDTSLENVDIEDCRIIATALYAQLRPAATKLAEKRKLANLKAYSICSSRLGHVLHTDLERTLAGA